MIRVFTRAGIALTLALLIAAAAQAKNDTKCERCGMSWDASPTSLAVTFKGEKSSHFFESMACLVQSSARDKVASAKVIDYNSKNRAQIDALSAHYLYDTERIPHSMPPFIAAFSSKKAALAAQKDMGGEYATFDQVWSKLAKHFSKGGH